MGGEYNLAATENHFLEGTRLYLRDVRLADVDDAYYRWMNDPDVTRYLETRFYPNSQETLRDYVSSKVGDHENVFLAIVLKETNQQIGNIKLGSINWVHRIADIGVLIGKRECWGQGYATEAIRLVVDYAFSMLNLRKLTAGCYGSNQGSIRAFEKVGFSVEGVRKQHYSYNGEYVDGIMLGLIRSEAIQ